MRPILRIYIFGSMIDDELEPPLNEDELEELMQADFIANAQSDIDDVMSGRIKSPEHLEAVTTLLDKLCDLSANADEFSASSEEDMYGFINSKSIEELNAIFKKLDDFQEWFNATFKA